MPSYIFYERDDVGDRKVGFMTTTTSKLPDSIKKILEEVIMPDRSVFDRHNPDHLQTLPLIFSGQRLYVVEQV